MAPNLNQTELIYANHIVTTQELPLGFLICVIFIFILMCIIYIFCCIGHFQGDCDLPYMHTNNNSATFTMVESIVKKFPKFSNYKSNSRRKSKYPTLFNDVDLLNDSDFENYHTDSDSVWRKEN